jgi:hypothetical protein
MEKATASDFVDEWEPSSFLPDNWQAVVPYPSWNEVEDLANKLAAARAGMAQAITPWSNNYWHTVLSALETKWYLMTRHLEIKIQRSEAHFEPSYKIRYDWLSDIEYRGNWLTNWFHDLADFLNRKLMNPVDTDD